jgi:uncharacterized protein (TIGR03083 family)
MGEVADAYAGCRQRIDEVVRSLGDDAATTAVPTCPAWSVKDVAAHLAGVVDDALAGRLDGVASDRWTAAQVDARRDRPVSEILDEWNEKAPAFEDLLDVIGDPGRQAVFDTVTHEHDIRTATGATGARESDALQIALDFAGRHFVAAANDAGLDLAVCSTTGQSFGDPDTASATLTATPFELVRAISGRRSVDQLRSMSWSGDIEPALACFTWGPFSPAKSAIDE